MTSPPRNATPIGQRALRVIERRQDCYLNRLPRLSTNLYDDFVKVVVGKDSPKTFQVHKGLLIHHCSYFGGAFNGQFAEAETQTVTLDQDDPIIFQYVYNYIYAGRFLDEMSIEQGHKYEVPFLMRPKQLRLHLSSELEEPNIDQPHPVSLSFKQLFRLYMFADMRGAPGVLDTTLSLILAKVANELQIPIDLLVDLQSHVPEHCPLMTMLAHLIGLCASSKSILECEEHIPGSVMTDVFLAGRRALNLVESNVATTQPWTVTFDACKWHVGDCHSGQVRPTSVHSTEP